MDSHTVFINSTGYQIGWATCSSFNLIDVIYHHLKYYAADRWNSIKQSKTDAVQGMWDWISIFLQVDMNLCRNISFFIGKGQFCVTGFMVEKERWFSAWPWQPCFVSSFLWYKSWPIQVTATCRYMQNTNLKVCSHLLETCEAWRKMKHFLPSFTFKLSRVLLSCEETGSKYDLSELIKIVLRSCFDQLYAEVKRTWT